MKKKIILISIPAALVLLTAIFYCLIPVIAKSYIEKKIDEIQKEKNITLHVDEIEITKHTLSGKIGINLNGIGVKSNEAKEVFASIDKLHTEVQAWHGFHITRNINELNADTVFLQIVKSGDYCNYPFLHEKGERKTSTGYNERVSALLKQIDKYCPNILSIKKLEIKTDIDSLRNDYSMHKLNIKDKQFNGQLTILKDTTDVVQSRWNLKGAIDKENQTYEGEITLLDTGNEIAGIPLPYHQLKNSDIKFQKAEFIMEVKEATSEHTKLAVSGHIRNLQFYNRFVAKEPILIETTGGDLDLSFFKKSIQIDSTSELQLNEAVMHPFLCYDKNKSQHIIVKVNEQKCNAQKLFSSLPEGLFTIIPQMKVHGNIDYHLLFDCDFANVDNLIFDFGIGSKDHSFGIDKGAELITRFNEPFDYIFYDKHIDEATREEVEVEIVVPIDSTRNPYFCSFSQIPINLTNSILVSEDPSFFWHRGYLKDAIRNAMIADIKAHKMIRGGSTISQQLVKNLFLNRNKVLTRKIEELLLVWMIEDYNMIEKERMFEIYVNIVEWAPQVIGIGHAAEFYFGKKPKELTLNECTYLATLIRSPKSYRYTLDTNGATTANRQAELRFLMDRMKERDLVTSEEAASFNPRVQTHIVSEEQRPTKQ